MVFNLDMIKKVYDRYPERVEAARKILNRPLTFTEKILYTHLYNGAADKTYDRGDDYVNFGPDRTCMQDATAQMVLLQFMHSGKKAAAVPSSIHADHLIEAEVGAKKDLEHANNFNKEVYDFMASGASKFGIDFWKAGAGIIHQVVLENYAFPGGLMIGSDSHTVNAGGLGMVAVGVGGADVVDVITDMPWELKMPRLIGVKLTGKLNGWTAPKDVILKVAGMLTAKGGTGYIVEYFGEGAKSMSCTGKGTICNMGAEIGATTSTFGYDASMATYLKGTGRAEVAEMADAIAEHLTGDAEVYADPEKYFDKVIEINLSDLEPHINGPFTPDLATPISEFAKAVKENDWPKTLEVGLIGSCTNSSYEDISRAASVARQAVDKDLKVKAEFTITPGSEQVRFTAERDGFLDDFDKIGGMVLANACGPCIGQWKRHGADKKEKNSIITSFNRNFSKRNDGNPNTHSFVASPEMVTAMTIAGDMTFNPITDTLTNEKGEQVKLDEPTGLEMPPKGFDVEDPGYQAPAEDGTKVDVLIPETSKRLQLFTPFDEWDGQNISDMRVLVKAQGKCTTDHISPAGHWLFFRGHLENLSDNTLTGAVSAFNGETDKVKNHLSGAYDSVPVVQRAYQAAGVPTIVIGDENYGEGSSREHAAMQPRYLGVRVVITRSFARIHETNLKKQGMIACTFSNPEDYDKIQENDTIDLVDLTAFEDGKPLTFVLKHEDGSEDTIKANHSYNAAQIEWFKAGSALNLIRKQNQQ